MPRARSLRPRTLLGIFDSATEIAVSTPAVSALAFIGGLPIVVLGVLLCWVIPEGVPLPGGRFPLLLACGLATMWRFIPAGAVSALTMARLSGKEMSAGEAMRDALRKAPLLLAAGGYALFHWALSFFFLMVPLLFGAGAYMTSPMVMDGHGPPWKLAGQGRKLLGKRAGVPGGLSILWVLGIFLLGANLAGATTILLSIARGLTDLELGYIGAVLSPANPAFMPAMLGLSFLLLEPIRLTSIALAHADAKVRKEGSDLRAAMETVAAGERRRLRAPKGALFILLLALAPFLAGASAHGPSSSVDPAPARSASSSPSEHQARSLEEIAGELEARGARMDSRSAESMRRLLERIEGELERGKEETIRRRLEAAERELTTLSPPSPTGNHDARRVAREVLERREFRRVEARSKETMELPELSWLDRFFEFLDRLLNKQEGGRSASSGGLDLTSATTIAWGLLLLLFVILVVVLVGKTLVARGSVKGTPDVEEDYELQGAVRPGPLGLDPLSRSPSQWLAEADRLASLGEYRNALRAAYLALLSQLHRARMIDYSPTRTNWEHARAFRGPKTHGLVFSDLTRRFDRAWYGQREVGEAEYGEVRTRALSLFEDRTNAASEGGANA